jgi:superfamily II DNA/RNA helicase
MPKERQVLMFSATVPGHILEISHKYMKNPKRITIGSSTKPAPEVDQQFLKIPQSDKYKELGSQLASKEGTAIVFVTTKRGADKLTGRLRDDGHQADVIHGGLNQNKRSKVIARFRAEKTRVLVATDVAARGLDINHIKLVFNYDLPMAAEDYLHRIGRTGRAGAKGHAISFVSPEDSSKMRAIERLINKGESSPRESFKKKGRGSFESRNDRAGSSGEGRQQRYGKKSGTKRKFGEKSEAGPGFSPNGKKSGAKRKFGEKSEAEQGFSPNGKKSGAKRKFGAKSEAGQGFFPKKGNRPRNRDRAA